MSSQSMLRALHLKISNGAVQDLRLIAEGAALAAEYGEVRKARDLRTVVSATAQRLDQIAEALGANKLHCLVDNPNDVEGMYLHTINRAPFAVAFALPWKGTDGKESPARGVGVISNGVFTLLAVSANHDEAYSRARTSPLLAVA